LPASAVGSLLGAIAKLHCLLTREQPSPESEEQPWPEIRSVLIDLFNFVDAAGSLAARVCLGLEAAAGPESSGQKF